MKKLINAPEAVVAEMVEGLSLALPGLGLLPGHAVLVRSDAAVAREGRVALVSGGGSGHEPAHAGYVGRGMLSAAVAGEVFTSPSPDAVLAAIRAVAGPPGCLLIVKNYTGDRLNFGLAAEMARAEGLPVEMAIVADDVALAATTENAGRRGLAGAILVHKVAGAAAEAGLGLAEVAAEARAAAESVRTMGVALSACTVPAAGRAGFRLGEEEIELGLGIHGEPGVSRVGIEPADRLVERLLAAILDDLDPGAGGRVALLVNGLGGTPAMELAIVARHAVRVLEGRDLAVERVYLGNFLTALEMAGVSLTAMRLDDHRLGRLDAPTAAPSWPRDAGRPHEKTPAPPPSRPEGPPRESPSAGGTNTSTGRQVEAALRRVTAALIEAEGTLTEMDGAVGDGDLGISLARGARAVAESLPTLPLDDPAATFHALGMTLRRVLGGTSGPLYAAFLLRASTRLARGPADDPKTWADAFRDGTAAVAELGGAAPGDRTMLDALAPAVSVFAMGIESGQPTVESLRGAAEAADAGVLATAGMIPKRGRSSYLGERALGHPDPGARAVAIWLRAVLPPGAE